MAPNLLQKLKLKYNENYRLRVQAREKINSNISNNELIQYMSTVSDEVGQALAQKLSLQEFNALIKKTTPVGTVKGTNITAGKMIKSLSLKKVEELLTEKGVDPKAVRERAKKSDRDVEAVLRKAAELAIKCPSIPPNLLTDLAISANLLVNAGDMLDLWKPLEKRLSEDEGTDKHRLTKALREVEERHKFPEVRSLPVGILTSETFLGMTSWGFQAKDPGAGVEHGEFSHRLQWNALMTRFEQDMEKGIKWDNTPFELFTMLGEIDEQAAKNDEPSAWGAMMDSPGTTLGNEDTTVSDVRLARDGFLRPDNITHGMKIIDAINKKGEEQTLPNLSNLVEQRRNKRDQVRQKYSLEYPQKKSTLEDLIRAAKNNENGAKARLKLFIESNELLVKKWNIDTLEIEFRSGETYASEMAMNEYKERKLKQTSYKLNDKDNQEDMLLVGRETEELTDEQKRGNVLRLRDESRQGFNLPVKFGESEEKELRVYVNRIVRLLKDFNKPIDFDPVKVLNQAKPIGRQKGLNAAIEHVNNTQGLKGFVQFKEELDSLNRGCVRQLMNLMRKLRENENRNDLSEKEQEERILNLVDVETVEFVIDELNVPLSPQLVEFIVTSDRLFELEEIANRVDVDLELCNPLYRALTKAGLMGKQK